MAFETATTDASVARIFQTFDPRAETFTINKISLGTYNPETRTATRSVAATVTVKGIPLPLNLQDSEVHKEVVNAKFQPIKILFRGQDLRATMEPFTIDIELIDEQSKELYVKAIKRTPEVNPALYTIIAERVRRKD